jgi:hypothetical protein
MANELKHKSQGAGIASDAAFQAADMHMADGQTGGDILYFNGSTAKWERTNILSIAGGVPTILNETYLSWKSTTGAISPVLKLNSGNNVLLVNDAAGGIYLFTDNVGGVGTAIARLNISGSVATALATWSNITHTGFNSSGEVVLSGAGETDITGNSATNTMVLRSFRTAANAGHAFAFQVYNNVNALIESLAVDGGVAIPGWHWENALHYGLILGGEFITNGQTIKGHASSTSSPGCIVIRGGNGSAGTGAVLFMRGSTDPGAEGFFQVYTPNGSGTDVPRFQIAGAGAVATVYWSSVTHTGLVVTSGQPFQLGVPYTAKGAEAFTGYMIIKDNAGNDRKVMVCS